MPTIFRQQCGWRSNSNIRIPFGRTLAKRLEWLFIVKALDLNFAFRKSRDGIERQIHSSGTDLSLAAVSTTKYGRRIFFVKQVCAQPALDLRLKIVRQSPCFRAHWPRYRPNDAMNVNHLQHQALPAAEAGPTTLIFKRAHIQDDGKGKKYA
jgi:hypothetical protein